MVYLKSFSLLSAGEEESLGAATLRIYEGNYYPCGLFSEKLLKNIDFDNITIFYGGNGSGKTTLLNLISSKVGASRNSIIDKGPIFNDYAEHCDYDLVKRHECMEIRFISSDDVFDYLLDLRAVNSGVNRRKSALAETYFESKYIKKNNDFETYEELKDRVDSKRMTKSKFIRSRLVNNNIQEQSNGETALAFWESNIKENSIYILDEPENSLSAENQLKLKAFIEESARFYNCQFIISTHSPFILSLHDAKIYDLDSNPVKLKKWYDLPNVRVYYDFFKENKDDFEREDI